jgi:hypothetical protein
MTVATVDMAGALALAKAAGTPPDLAADLVMAAAEGIRSGLADRKDVGE